MKTLHITNGDGAASIIKASVISGDVLPWRDPMHQGPFPAGLSLDDLRPIRAKHLSGPGPDFSEAERDFRLRDEHLRSATQYERVILWFEHDLLDQLQILQILDWFAKVDLNDTELEIICINDFPSFDQFRGIGQLDTVQMASLFDHRVPVTSEMMTLAGAGWLSFRSEDPRDLIQFLQSDLHCLPFLRDALIRHLEDYPSAITGLTRTERQILSLVENGVHDPLGLFLQNMDRESALYLGDWGTYAVIEILCRAELLSCATAPFWYYATSAEERGAFKEQKLTLTDKGQKSMVGQIALASLIDRDQWLGGVHIKSGKSHWAWDADNADFVWLGE